MEKTVLISLCSLFFLGFTLNSHTIPDQKKERSSAPTEIVNVEVTSSDSIPSKGTYMIHKKTDSQDISIQVEDGDIKELKVDGKKIAPEQFNHYDEVIDELFGSMEAPPSAEGFNFTMPAMPPMPEMPDMPPSSFSYTMPAMPPMPSMPPMPAMGMNEMELEHLFGDGSNLSILKDGHLEELLKGQMGNLSFLSDTNNPEGAKIIIIRNGDSTVIVSPNIQWADGSMAPAMDRDIYIQNSDNWKQQQQAWKEQEEVLKKQWEENAQQWKNNWSEQQQQRMQAEQERMRSEGDRMREQGDKIRQETQEYMNSDDYNRALGDALNRELETSRAYSSMGPRMGMTDEMIEEGLVQPGEEAEVILTPDKLKINGKKMPENIHRKYLRMYEEQQGVELSGKSRVEFRTKSRRSM